jgi:cell division protein FtsL
MADNVAQSLQNHVRRDPLFHFFVLPVFSVAIIWSIVNLYRHAGVLAVAVFVFLVAILILAFKARLYALKVQTRVIRLEERLRLQDVLAEPLRSRIRHLSESQLVALRFASDAECPALVEDALANNRSNADIKKAIKQWRADDWRV